MGCAASAPQVSGDAKLAGSVRESASSGEPARPPASPGAAAPSESPSLPSGHSHAPANAIAIVSPEIGSNGIRAGDMKRVPDTNGHAAARPSPKPTPKSSMTPEDETMSTLPAAAQNRLRSVSVSSKDSNPEEAGDEVPKDLPEYAVKVRNSIRRATPQVQHMTASLKARRSSKSSGAPMASEAITE